MGAPHCWACSIPDLTWAKLALLNAFVWYDVSAKTIVVSHAGLYAAEQHRQRLRKRFRWPVAVSEIPVTHQWRVNTWETMGEADWEKLTTELAEAVMHHQYDMAP